MDINLDLYKTFCTVARCGSISAAANELYVSQSAVSQSVKQLETQLGGILFNRGARGVTLTSEGETLFEYANNAYSMLENAEKRFNEMKDLKSGEIKIGASDTICSLFLIDSLNKFHTEYPDIKLHLINRTSDELISSVKNGIIDIAFINLPEKYSGPLNSFPIMEINDCFVASGKYSHLLRRTVSLGELADYPILMLDKNSSSRRNMDNFLASKGVFIQPSVELGSMDLLIKCAKIGLGISHIIEQSAQSLIKSGELYKLQLSESLPKREVSLISSSSSLSFAARRFVDFLADNPV